MPALDELCLAIVDCEHKTAPKSDTGYPLVRTTDIGRGRLDLLDVQCVDASTYEAWTRRAIPQPGDLILAREAPVGNVALVTPGLEPVLGQRTVLIRPDPERVDSDYLCYRLLGHDIQHWMTGVANGATVPHLNMEDIRALPVPPLPALDEQRKMGAALAAFDDLIENNRRRIEALEETARLVYREWFVNFRFPGHGGASVVESESPVLRKGWQWRNLGDVARWLSGGTPNTKEPSYWHGDIPWITSGSLTSFLLGDSDRKLTPEGVTARSRVVDRDTLLFVVRGMSLASEFRHGIADVRLAFGQDCKALVAQEGLDPLVLAFAVADRSEEIQQMVEFAAHGTGKLSTDRLKALTIPVPPEDVQDQFVAVVRPMRELMSVLRRQVRTLEHARDLLLPRLVCGELDVSELDPKFESGA